jgi:HEAT repeat protein
MLGVSLTVQGQAEDKKPADDSNKTVGEWIKELKEGTEVERTHVVRKALGPSGPFAKTAIPALIDALDDFKEDHRSSLTVIIEEYGPSAIPHLIRALKRQEVTERSIAAETLGRIRPKAIDAVPALIEALADTSPKVRTWVLVSLGEIRLPYDKSIPAIMKAVKDEDADVRTAALAALEKFGPRAAPAVPMLAAAISDVKSPVRDQTFSVLGRIGPAAKQALPALIEALDDRKFADSRESIAEALGGIGGDAKEVVPALIELLSDREERVRTKAVYSLQRLGPAAAAAVPALIKLAQVRSRFEGGSALRAIEQIGSIPKAALPWMVEQFLGKEAFDQIGRDPKAALPGLIAIARAPERRGGDYRERAARLVGRIDPDLFAKEKLATAHLDVQLGKVPVVKMASRAAATDEQKKRIKGLIAKLAETRDSDAESYANLPTMTFAPLPKYGNNHSDYLLVEEKNTSEAFRALVEMGPLALPFLLESMEDKTSTQMGVFHGRNSNYGGFDVPFSIYLSGNPLNRAESAELSKKWTPNENDDEDESPNFFRIKVGDLCFEAVGQIVNRRYKVFWGNKLIGVTSATEQREVRDRVRAIWSSKDPAQRLLEYLLIDYATVSKLSAGRTSPSSTIVRLLYYYPKETAPLIATRLKSLDVKKVDRWTSDQRDDKNGVATLQFIEAAAWCREPVIKEALADIAKRTDDPDIKRVLDEGAKK